VTGDRDRVRERYAAAADRIRAGQFDATGCGAARYTDEPGQSGLPVEASLDCGNPIMIADLRPGETVLDLGSGAGLDIPLPDDSVDVVISNCVLTLSADHPAVFAEIARVLRPGGRLGISDVVADASLTYADRVECLAHALTTDQYVAHLVSTGMTDVDIRITHPMDDTLHAATIRATKPTAPRRVRVVPMSAAHAAGVLAVYQAGLDTGNASFETTAPSWSQWGADHLAAHRFVALDENDEVVGWVAAAPVSSRCVYAGVLEHSIYVRPDQQGRGVGRALLDTYIAATEAAGVWTLQSGIFPENLASLALHERAGFRVVGRRERIGQHHGRWRDVVFIERRAVEP
jgi:L-amino acid N-acyltransferase YncA